MKSSIERSAATLMLVGLAGVVMADSPARATEPQTEVDLASAMALVELEGVRAATERFRDLEQALAEGYVDIGLFIPNMGHHYLKGELLDGRFDPNEPELLVYADDPCGPRRLVAVEYAVPLELAHNAPRGFTGKADGWVVNEQFQLWTLHAWIWEYNPHGVFASHNPRLP